MGVRYDSDVLFSYGARVHIIDFPKCLCTLLCVEAVLMLRCAHLLIQLETCA